MSEISLQDLLIYIVFLISTTFLAMSITEDNAFYFVQAMGNLFLKRLSYNEYGFKSSLNDLVTVDDWWLFVRTTFAENIPKIALKNESNFGGYAWVTLPRLRQLRVRNETCNVNESFRNLYSTCYGQYSSENEESNNNQNYTYMTASEVGASFLWGTVTTYQGGGYIERLSIDIGTMKQTLDSLDKKNWIDRATRAVIVEFALFNANSNLFGNIKLLAEFPSAGEILSLNFISLLKYSILEGRVLVYIFALLFYGLIIYYTIILILTVSKTRLASVLFSIWGILDLMIILLGHITLIYIIWHSLHLEKNLKNGTINSHYFSLDVICQWYTFFTFTVGLCVFLVWIKLLKYVSLHVVMRQFSKTLQRSAHDLLGFAIMFFIIFVSYANLSVLLFGSSQEHFRDFRNALLSTMRMVLCDFDYTEIEEEYPVIAPVFFLSYILFVFFILMNMFLAILYDTYSEVKTKLKSGKLNTIKKDLLYAYEKLKMMFSKSISSTKVSMESHELLTKTLQKRNILKRKEIKILTTYFEILSDQRSQEVTEELYQKIQLLEESLNRLMPKMEYVLNKMKTSGKL